MINTITQYVPSGARELLQNGSTANIWRHPTRTGVVMKSPRGEPQDQSHMHKFRTEVGILKALGEFPDTSEIIGGDIIKDCWDQKIKSAEEAHRRLVELDRQQKSMSER